MSTATPISSAATTAVASANASSSAMSRTASFERPLRNALGIFVAHFHVRRGNEIVWSRAAPAACASVEEVGKTSSSSSSAASPLSRNDFDLTGVEWKVLPSGSHLIERDVIYFEPPASKRTGQGNSRIGVACFRNRRLSQGEVSTGALPDEEADDQRGARMVAVGTIVECGESTPFAHLAATLAHLPRLEKLADSVAADPLCRGILEEWLDIHKLSELSSVTQSVSKMGAKRDLTSNLPLYSHDPMLQLPAISTSLGPLLPTILKQLLLPSYRLIIFCPAGSPSFRACAIAYALAELVHGAHETERPFNAARQGEDQEQRAQNIVVRGLIGLHDIAMLEDEAKLPQTSSIVRPSWIAWSADKILLEKPHLFDAILDLSPIAQAVSLIKSTAYGDHAPVVLPRLARVHRPDGSETKPKPMLKRHTWTTREFSVFRGLDEQASLMATTTRFRRMRRRGSRVSILQQEQQKKLPDAVEAESSQIYANGKPSSIGSLSSTRSRSRTNMLSTMAAFLRFWLSGWWILPAQWRLNLRESYGYVPLSIRGDGGVRASIMLLPDSDEEDDDEDNDEDEDEDENEEAVEEGEIERQGEGANEESEGHQRKDQEERGPGLERRSSSRLRKKSSRSLRMELGDEEGDGSANDYIEEDPDPIMAAVGAMSQAQRRRRSQPPSAASAVGDVVAHQVDGSRRPASPLSSRFSTRTGSGIWGEDTYWDEEEEEKRLARESARLAKALHKVWSEWAADLVLGVQDLVEEKADVGGEVGRGLFQESLGQNEANVGGDDQQASLLLSHDDATPLQLTASEVSVLGLSGTNEVDVALIETLAFTVTDRPVFVKRGWPLVSWLW